MQSVLNRSGASAHRLVMMIAFESGGALRGAPWFLMGLSSGLKQRHCRELGYR
jgi:hypothetical protein